MAINKVGSKGIEDGSVATADFAPGTVTSAKLQDNAVTNAKLTNTTVTLAGQSITLGASTTLANKFVDWQSVITADGSTGTTAVSGRGYFIDTTSAAHTITLPASASIGDFIAIKDYAGTFATNNLTIGRNGHNIQGVANNSLITTNRASLVLVYVDSTKGWLYWEEHNVGELVPTFIQATGGTVTTSGNYKIHTFTGDGCFVICSTANAQGGPNGLDIMVVAGGGAGGGFYLGSGAGGGGTVYQPGVTAVASTYPVTVGGGGSSASPGNPGDGGAGSNSTFYSLTGVGGAGGVSSFPQPGGPFCGANGGSGSGGSQNTNEIPGPSYSSYPGGTATQSSQPGNSGTYGYGSNGGSSVGPVPGPQGTPAISAGGGGGAGGVGGNGTNYKGGAMGIGIGPPTIPWMPTSLGDCGYFAGGGGGGAWSIGGALSDTALGGGGRGINNDGPNTGLENADANTGGGGGGLGGPTSRTGGSGGKGIVIIRYKYQ